MNDTKHPNLFYLFFFNNIFERFAFYIMQTTLVLFMTQALLFPDTKAYEIFAVMGALVYLTPVIGGQLTDSILGIKNALLLGALILFLGYSLLAIPTELTFYTALACICTGIGLFIPNIANAVGKLYSKENPKKDECFSLFYAGTNFGAFLPPLFIGFLINRAGWHLAFLMSALSIAVMLILLLFGLKHYNKNIKYHAIKPKEATLLIKFMLACGFCAFIFIAALLIYSYKMTNIILLLVGTGFVIFTIGKAINLNTSERKGVIAALILTLVSIIFWVLFLQAGTSLTIFAKYNVNRHIGDWTMPPLMLRASNPLFVILIAPFIGRLWVILSRYNINPSVPIKFAIGLFFMGAGFVLIQGAIKHFSDGHNQIHFIWVVGSYFLQSIGELLLSPVGLSMISEVSPSSMGGLMMGIWYFATTIANILAGFAASLTADPSGSNNPAQTTVLFQHTFGILGWLSIAIGLVFMFFVAPKLSNMMKQALHGDAN